MKKNKNEKNDSSLNQENSNCESQETNAKERFFYPDYPYFSLDEHKYIGKEKSESRTGLTGSGPLQDEEGIQNENNQILESSSNALNSFLMDVESCDSRSVDLMKMYKKTEEPEKGNDSGSYEGDNIRDNDEHQNDNA